jgi:hypothetical protein
LPFISSLPAFFPSLFICFALLLFSLFLLILCACLSKCFPLTCTSRSVHVPHNAGCLTNDVTPYVCTYNCIIILFTHYFLLLSTLHTFLHFPDAVVFISASSFSMTNLYVGLLNLRTASLPQTTFFLALPLFYLFPVRPILSPSLLSSIFDRRCARYRFADSLCRKSQLQTPISAELKESNLSRIFSQGFTC